MKHIIVALAMLTGCTAAQDKLQYAQDKQQALRDRCEAIRVALETIQDGRDVLCPFVGSLPPEMTQAYPAKEACAKGALVDEVLTQTELVCSVFGGSDVKEQTH
jgi:hypothetical protein